MIASAVYITQQQRDISKFFVIKNEKSNKQKSVVVWVTVITCRYQPL